MALVAKTRTALRVGSNPTECCSPMGLNASAMVARRDYIPGDAGSNPAHLGNRAFRGVDVCSDQAATSGETER